MPQVQSDFERRRSEEMEAGRRAIQARMQELPSEKKSEVEKHFAKIEKAAKQQIKEDEERRHSVLNDGPDVVGNAERDRAAADVEHQRNIALQSAVHLADRAEKTITSEQQLEAEALERANAAEVIATVTDIVTAQAVNQPTILANNEGEDTENFALNQTGIETRLLDSTVLIPSDLHVPKTRKDAEKKAKNSVPKNAKQMLTPGIAHVREMVEPAADGYTFPEDNQQLKLKTELGRAADE